MDLKTNQRTVFARNRNEGPAKPASMIDLEDAFERPVDVKVGPDGLVYVLDFGVFEAVLRPAARAAQDREVVPHRAGHRAGPGLRRPVIGR